MSDFWLEKLAEMKYAKRITDLERQLAERTAERDSARAELEIAPNIPMAWSNAALATWFTRYAEWLARPGVKAIREVNVK